MKVIAGNNKVKKNPMLPYADIVCDFLDAYSYELRHDTEAKKYSDVMTFSFWARKGNIIKKKEQFINYNNGIIRLGRGIIFHIAPSNVPVNCIFTYAFGLLAGNANVVRIPTKRFRQLECMLRILEEVISRDEYLVIKEMTSFVQYEKTEYNITQQLSYMCDVRVIWGGDETINAVRKFELQPRSIDITFPDRYSFGIIDVNTIDGMSECELRSFAQDFYNDTYLMDQNACSSPQLICWRRGDKTLEDVEKTKERFWNMLYEVAKKYDFADIKASEKYAMLCELVMSGKDINTKNGSGENMKVRRYGNLIYVCDMKELSKDAVDKCRGKYGLFFEYVYCSLDELNVLSNTRVQTCVVCGVEKEKIQSYIIENGFWMDMILLKQ